MLASLLIAVAAAATAGRIRSTRRSSNTLSDVGNDTAESSQPGLNGRSDPLLGSSHLYSRVLRFIYEPKGDPPLSPPPSAEQVLLLLL